LRLVGIIPGGLWGRAGLALLSIVVQ